MTKLDDQIKAELEKETSEIDELLAKEGGLPDMVSAAWHGGMRRWIWITGFFVFLLSAVLFWCGYEFFTATTLEDRVYWGFCTLLSLAPQVALKQWQWMEMNRSSMMREIKRLELAVATLSRQHKN
jgi:hypothetical protein